MGPEYGEVVEHEGERFLRLLGFEDMADRRITTSDGEEIAARDFLDICGEHARETLVGFAAMSPDDPQYEAARDALRSVVQRYVGGEE